MLLGNLIVSFILTFFHPTAMISNSATVSTAAVILLMFVVNLTLNILIIPKSIIRKAADLVFDILKLFLKKSPIPIATVVVVRMLIKRNTIVAISPGIFPTWLI